VLSCVVLCCVVVVVLCCAVLLCCVVLCCVVLGCDVMWCDVLSSHVTSCYRSLTIRVMAPGFDEFMLIGSSKNTDYKIAMVQGNNELCFFKADPIFVLRFLILDSKSVTNFGPLSYKYGTAWSLIPKKLLIPIPWSLIPDPGLVIPDTTLLIPDPTPLIPDPIYRVTTLTGLKLGGRTVARGD